MRIRRDGLERVRNPDRAEPLVRRARDLDDRAAREAAEQARDFLKGSSLDDYCDTILLEGLRLAEADRRLGHLDEERLNRIVLTVDELVADLEANHDEGVSDVPSIDIVSEFVLPILERDKAAVFIVVDCLRLDQWRALEPLLAPYFDVETTHYYAVLPTATPYSRNALFSGLWLPASPLALMPMVWPL